MVILQSSRLVLRAARPEDAAALFDGFSDPEVMRYWSEPPHPNSARTEAWLSTMTGSSQNGITDFVICLKTELSVSGDVPIGKIGIYASRPANEIGFLLARQHWHKGYAREALTLILDYLFNLENEAQSDESQDALNRERPNGHTILSGSEMQSKWLYPSITADTDPRNAASIGVLKKMGFQQSGYERDCFEVDGVWVDSQYLKLTRCEWLASLK